MKKTITAGGPGRKSRGGTLLGLFIGLVVGVLISFAVVWMLNKTPLPFQDKAVRAERAVGANGAAGETPAPLPGKPGDKVTEKPRFEFYKILPGGQDGAPAATETKPTDVKPAEAKPAPAAESLYLQVGAFQKPADADNLKAKLAMMGVEAGIQEVEIPEKGKMHRVRVGPFASAEEMNRVRGQLSQNGVQATPVKIK